MGMREVSCSNCGVVGRGWSACCVSCKAWNTLAEIKGGELSEAQKHKKESPVKRLSDVVLVKENRISSGCIELDRILGGGVLAGSVLTLAGDPGGGKSTLTLQALCSISDTYPTLLVSCEEGEGQVANRANRLGLIYDDLFVTPDRNLSKVIAIAESVNAKFIVIDSLQKINFDNGDIPSTEKDKAVVDQFIEYAKSSSASILLICQVNKKGEVLGAKHIEHMVDVNLRLDVDGDARFLSASKNRFGAIGAPVEYYFQPDSGKLVWGECENN